MRVNEDVPLTIEDQRDVRMLLQLALDEMEEEGLIERTVCPDRQIRWSLTQKGRRIATLRAATMSKLLH